jgi:hypothetical protein
MTTAPPQQPAGWYPDPNVTGSQRYWDGAAWSEHTAPAGETAPTPPVAPPQAQAQFQRSGSPVRKIVGGIAGAIAIIFGILVVIGALSGDTIDPAKAEQGIRSHFPVHSVKCPDGVEVKTGKTFECSVVLADGSKAKVTVHVLNTKGDITASGSDFHQ